MRRLTWELQRILARLGWPLLAGLTCFSAAATLHRFVLIAEPARIASIQRDIALLRTELRTRLSQPTEPTENEKLAGLYQSFPISNVAQHTDVLAKLQSAAAAEGLLLEQASYRLTLMSDEALPSLQIELPVKAGYAPLRRFVTQALHDTPALALEGFTLSRASVAEPAVEAKLLFVLYMRSAAGGDGTVDVGRIAEHPTGAAP